MPLTQENIEAICTWVKGDECAIGGIYSQDGDLSCQLAKALCEDTEANPMPTILYVRTTQLEASLLEQDIVQAIPEAGEYVSVWSGEGELPDVALTTYAVLHSYLRNHTGPEQPLFEDHTLVVLEHEIGVWVEGIITRDMLALVAAGIASDRDGPWIKILGLSYSASPREWLRHPIRLMGDPNGRVSLDILVRGEDQVNDGSSRRAVWDRDGIEACAIGIARVLKESLNVVVFSTSAKFRTLRDAVEDLHAGEFTTLKNFFLEWPQVELTQKSLAVFGPAEKMGHMICMPHDGYPCALPFGRIGMVVITAPGRKPVYNKKARVCLRSNLSLTQSQYRIESSIKSPGQASPSVVCFVSGIDDLPNCANHLINWEDDYLAGWLSVISSYPARPIEELPFFGALQGPAYSHDCLAQLQVMGLVEVGSDGAGFTLTEQGARVVWAYDCLTRISLSGISALAEVSLHLRHDVARSAARLILLLEHYPTAIKMIAQQGDAISGDEFGSMLQELAVSSRNGGPGRKHVDRGSLWAAWVAFEDAAFGMDFSLGNFEELFADTEISPRMKRPPFILRATGVSDFAEDVCWWEHKLGLENLRENDWAGFQLSDSEADTIQGIMAKAYYPYLLDVPVRLKDEGSLKDMVGASLYRSKSMVRGSGPMHNFFKAMWAANARAQAPTHSSYMYAGLSTSALGSGDMGNEITANAVMIMPYRTALVLDKDGVDKWARMNSEM